MKVLFWVPYPTQGASNRYRVEQYLPYLERSNIEYDLRLFWRSSAFGVLYKRGHRFKKVYFFILGTLSRIFDILRAAQYDAVFIHREAYPIGGAFFETLLTILRKPLIFDFDDAIFLPSTSKSNSFIEILKSPNKIATIIKKSRYIIAGNHYLADFALRYNSAVTVIPTPIDTDKYYPCVTGKNNEKIVIGWMGSATTVDFLDIVNNVFAALSKRFCNVIFKIVGSDFSPVGIKNIISKPWALEEEVADLRSFDIGIMPMPDNKWTKGKCGFKAILYMSMGIPCVCSGVGVNKEIIKDGWNGFLADTEAEWIEKLSILIDNPELRHKMGLMGRKTIEEKYSIKINAPKFTEVIQKTYKEKYAK